MEIINWCQKHWFDLVMLPGNILAIEAIVRQAAVDAGYKNVVSLCDRIAKILSFIGDIITGLINRKGDPNASNSPNPGSNPNNPKSK